MNARALALPLSATPRMIFLCSGLVVEVLHSFVAGMTALRTCVRKDDFVWMEQRKCCESVCRSALSSAFLVRASREGHERPASFVSNVICHLFL